MIDREGYCRELEAYLCRKNDGHLIRIVGPAFEEVSNWARDGIPLKVACAGIDRYFERYYRKGPRRRPVRIEFCEADVRDVFEDWRRAVGVARAPEAESGDDPAPHKRGSLSSHIERTLARLTALRAGTQVPAPMLDLLERLSRRLDSMQPEARRARGDARAVLTLELDSMDRELIEAATDSVPLDQRGRLQKDAERELEPFRDRMAPDAFARAYHAATERLIREQLGLPTLRF